MRQPLILTKLKVLGDIENLLNRPRLIEKLIEGMNYRLTLIHGPAGFGKTSLAMQWRDYLLKHSICAAWLSLDPDDNDIERCISHIVAAINMAEPSIDVSTIFLAKSQSQQTINYILTELINKLESVNNPIYLILDDWHLIHNHTIQNALTFLIDYAPCNFHLTICSRSQPTLSLYTLRAKNQLFEIDISDLRFSKSELNSFFSDANQQTLSPNEVHLLWEKTEGWVASLQLILLLSRSGHSLKSLSDNLSENHSISEYLVENAINSLPPDTLNFLLKTSILDRLNGELCNLITQRNDSQTMLVSLYKQGMFIRPLDPEFYWFQYHHLFTRFLRKHLQRQNPNIINELHCIASDWYASQSQIDEAVHHALEAKDKEKAINLVEQRAMWLIEHGFTETLLNLIDKLPTEEINTRIPLQMAIAWAHCLTHRHTQAQTALNHVNKLLKNQPCKQHSIEINVLQATLNIYTDRFDEIEKLLTPCLKQKDSKHPWTLVVGHNVMTYVLLNTYRYQEAIQLQQKIQPFYSKTQGPFSSICGDNLSGLAKMAQCQLQAAEEYFSRALDKACQHDGEHSHMSYLAGALLGRLYYEQNQLDKAEKLLSRSRKLGVESGVVDFYIATYCFSARLEILKENFSEAYQTLNEGLKIAEALNMPRLDFIMRAEHIKLFLRQNDIQSAQRHMQQWDKINITYSASPGIAEQMIDFRERTRARLLCKVSQCQQTIDMLSTILEETIRNARHYSEVKVRTVLAAALEHTHNTEKAEEILLPALKTGFKHNIKRTFIDEGSLIQTIITRLIKHWQKPCRQQTDHIKSPRFKHWLIDLLSHFPAPTPNEETQHTHSDPLKEKEIQILKMLEKGQSNKEISKNLNIGINTVKWYLKNIYTKLGVSRRTQAITKAKELDLIA